MNTKQVPETRQRILEVAAQLFADKGYNQSTTREICLNADINITAIHYYFKNKAGLYRSIFIEAFDKFPKPELNTNHLDSSKPHESLIYFYKILLAPFWENKFAPHKMDKRSHALHHLVHELVAREQFEPTGIIDDLIAGPAEFIHTPLVKFITKYLHLESADAEVHRIAFALVGLGFSLIHPRHIVNHFAPTLLNQENWQENMLTRLADFAYAIIKSELTSRQKTKYSHS